MSWLSDPILIEVNDKSESSDESESEKAAVEVDDTEEGKEEAVCLCLSSVSGASGRSGLCF